MTEHDADVLIVGAGMAGTTAATTLARSGVSVILVDRGREVASTFKAEKIERDQAEILRALDLLEPLEPVLAQIGAVTTVDRTGGVSRIELEQYGGYYHRMVERFRQDLHEAVDFRVGRVTELETGPGIQTAELADGSRLRARLIVLAAGPTPQLGNRLGISRRVISAKHSLSFGFSIARTDRRPFDFESINYYCEDDAERIGYLTLFSFPDDEMRANLFTYWDPAGPKAREFLEAPELTLRRLFPRLTDDIGAFEVVTKVRTGVVDLFETDGQRQAGVVLIGDSFQRACPTTGKGLSMVLTAVDVLCRNHIPSWLATEGMDVDKIERFYDDPAKRDVDRVAMSASLYAKDLALGATRMARLQRSRAWSRMVGWVRRRRLLLNLAAASYYRIERARGAPRR